MSERSANYEMLIRSRGPISEIERLAIIEERVEQILEKLEDQAETHDKLRESVDSLTALTEKWKGGIVVLALLGSFVGWAVSSWETISAFFHKMGS